MKFTDVELLEYQEIIRQETGECISTDEAIDQTSRIYELFVLINENGDCNTSSL